MANDVVYESFLWDRAKEITNEKLHGVNFLDASSVFFDPHRVILMDERHSHAEMRYFCIGKLETKIMTVRFTYRGDKIRIIGAGFWRKGRNIYEKKNKK